MGHDMEALVWETAEELDKKLATSNQSFVNLKSNTYEKNTVQRYHISGK